MSELIRVRIKTRYCKGPEPNFLCFKPMPSDAEFTIICVPPPLAPHKDYITSNIFQYTWICNILQYNVIYSLPELFENAMEIKREREGDTMRYTHYLSLSNTCYHILRRSSEELILPGSPSAIPPATPRSRTWCAKLLNIQHRTTQIGAQVRECCILASAYFWDTFQEVYDSFPQQHWMTRISTDI